VEAAQRAKSSSLTSSDARPLTRIMRRMRAGRMGALPVLSGLGATVCALLALAWLERSVATGFRTYVLTHALRTAWTTTIALAAATVAAAAVTLAAGRRRSATPAVRAAAIAIAFVTAIAALGGMLPDWSEFTCGVAGAVVALWAAAILIASLGSRHSSNK
jgi:hypothetical protein